MSIDRLLTRRKWFEQISGPAVAATVAAGFATPAFASEPTGAGKLLAGAAIFNVREHGAAGDGRTLDTAAVQSAIDACAAEGGGTVLVPAGTFVIGTVELKSNVTLHLAAQGRLLGSPDPAHYRPGRGIPTSNGNLVLLSASEAENVTIAGPGTIDGNGARFYTGRGDNTGPGAKASEGYFQRPHLLIFHRCRNLRMRDVFLTASAYHAVRILQCERVSFTGVRIHNRVNRNNDGFHFYSNTQVHLSDCEVACQDDACALFGSNQFVTIVNCRFSTRWAVFRFGGGDARNITIANCIVSETYGCPIKMRCSAGSRFENILFSNLVLDRVTGPISIGLDSSRLRSDAGAAPGGIVRNIAFHGLRATVVDVGGQHADLPWVSEYRPGETRTCITLNGVGAEMLENISFTDVHVTYAGGGTAQEAAATVPEMAGEYFEIGTPPAYGLYARNVRGLTLHNVRFGVEQPDARPAVVLERVADAAVNGFAAPGGQPTAPVCRISRTQDVLFTGCRVLTPASAFLQLAGGDNHGLIVDGGDLARAAQPVELGPESAATAVKLRV